MNHRDDENGETVSLNDAVRRYQAGGQGSERIIERLAWEIYSYPRKKQGACEDDAGEFYLYFYPRLRRLLDRFQDRGIPFDHYFRSALHWNWKSYRRRRRKQEIERHAGRRFTLLMSEESEGGEAGFPMPESPAPEFPFPLFHLPIDREGRIDGRAKRRRFLFLALRFAAALTPANVESVARLTGLDAEWITRTADSLKEGLAPRLRRLEQFRARRNRVLFRRFLLQWELAVESDPEARAKLEVRLDTLSRRLDLAMHGISRISLAPTHHAIAAALALPKGTVDTGLRWCRITLSERPNGLCSGNGVAARIRK